MSKVNPRVDLAFKKIFGVEENKDLLISLINSIVNEKDQIVEVTLLNPYNPKNFKADKLSILDIKAKSESSKRYNIEIQVTDEADYDKRALYYWAKMYTEQLKEGSDYAALNKIIGIHILNFTSITDTDEYHNSFQLKEIKSGLVYFKDIELHTIELNKFAKNPKEELSDVVKKVKNALDIWLAFLTRNDLLNKDNLPKELDNDVLKKALTVLEVINLNDAEREEYENRLEWLRIETSAFKKMKEEGRAEGKARRNIEIAKEMLIDKDPLETIIKYTKLSKEEIEKLKAEIDKAEK
ncbi:Rpn family recombination-promoting nuclease/putative transposase [Rickettsia gravesii]|uniref:Rpn family recombination-promoting nuclease/putative transposase n=1 Tax=Rickettsia gravesii TaxID=354585 RepID=UPI00037A8A86|nr:Rpn family recombination-promoting nuclease/putative transposase [Rickettsia gravesii]